MVGCRANAAPSPRERVTVALVAAFFAAVLVLWRCLWPTDDALITLRGAENLAHGCGLHCHPGKPWRLVTGTSTSGQAVALGLLYQLSVAVTTVLYLPLSWLRALRNRHSGTEPLQQSVWCQAAVLSEPRPGFI